MGQTECMEVLKEIGGWATCKKMCEILEQGSVVVNRSLAKLHKQGLLSRRKKVTVEYEYKLK
jgi:predicted transcriptional regulator